MLSFLFVLGIIFAPMESSAEADTPQQQIVTTDVDFGTFNVLLEPLDYKQVNQEQLEVPRGNAKQSVPILNHIRIISHAETEPYYYRQTDLFVVNTSNAPPLRQLDVNLSPKKLIAYDYLE